MSKKISKEKLDSAIEMTRMYWRGGGVALLDGIRSLCEEMAGSFMGGSQLKNFISSIVGAGGIGEDADNETIYNALQLFGWDIVRDEE